MEPEGWKGSGEGVKIFKIPSAIICALYEILRWEHN